MIEVIKFIGNTELYTSELYEHSTIDQCIQYFKDAEYIGLDTETEGMDCHTKKIVMLQLWYNNVTYVIDTRVTSILPLKEILESKLILGQNLKFDYKFLKAAGITLSNIYDTFLAECCLTNGLENRELGLAALAKNYCGITLDKSTRNQFTELNGQPFTEKQIVYGVGDVTCLLEIKNKQAVRIKELELETVVDLENKACLALADIEYNGWNFDREKWLELAKNTKASVIDIELAMDTMVAEEPRLEKFVSKYIQTNMFDFNIRKVEVKWSSPTQVLKVIKKLGVKVESVSAKEIAQYENRHPLIKKYIDYTKERKLVTTYGKGFLRYVTKENKIYTSFWQILDTHRVSSGSKRDQTPNLQNLPADNKYLNCFIAGEGYKIIGIDYAAQEARVAAYGSQDDVWMNTFLEGKDLHSEVCKMMFGITDDLVKTKPDFLRGKSYRDVAKTINFGVLFGMSKFKLSKSLQITVEEAEKLIQKYFQATFKLKEYLKWCSNYGKQRGYIRSYKPLSGIRFFPQWREDLNKESDFKILGEIERASYNTPIQMTASLITKLALHKVREDIINNKRDYVELVHVVHDAIYTRCKTEFAEEYSKIQNQLMVDAWNEVIDNFPIGTDITITDFWSK